MTDREAKELNKINKKLSHGIPILVTPTYPPWLDLMDPEMGQKWSNYQPQNGWLEILRTSLLWVHWYPT
jgi:hypothetical protein